MNYTAGLHYNIEIEQAVLGISLMEAGAFARVYGLMKAGYFYSDAHQVVFSAMSAMYQTSQPLDILTVCDHLARVMGKAQLAGDNVGYFITNLTYAVQGSAHLEYWCHTLHAMFLEREIIRLTHGGFKGSGDARQQLGELQLQLAGLNQQVQADDWQDMPTLMVKMYQYQDAFKSGAAGLKMGFSIPDKECGGMQAGQLIILAARPGVGKSALAGQIGLNVARSGAAVGFVSLEMSDVQVAARIAAMDTETDYSVLLRGLYRDQREAETLYSRIGSSTINLPIYVSDKTSVNILDIRAKAEKLKRQHGLGLIIIDYLQLMDSVSGPSNRNRENEVAQMSRGLKVMAKEMGVPIIALCQLNRESVKRKGGDRFPQLSDLRESGAIEQDADVVLFIHSDWATGITADENGDSTEGKAHLVCRKWRDAPPNWVIPLEFNGPQMRFIESGKVQVLKPMPQAPHSNSFPNNPDDQDDPF